MNFKGLHCPDRLNVMLLSKASNEGSARLQSQRLLEKPCSDMLGLVQEIQDLMLHKGKGMPCHHYHKQGKRKMYKLVEAK